MLGCALYVPNEFILTSKLLNEVKIVDKGTVYCNFHYVWKEWVMTRLCEAVWWCHVFIPGFPYIEIASPNLEKTRSNGTSKFRSRSNSKGINTPTFLSIKKKMEYSPFPTYSSDLHTGGISQSLLTCEQSQQPYYLDLSLYSLSNLSDHCILQ